jgi:hypothetical protein
MMGSKLPERLPEAYLAEARDRFGVVLDPRTADEVVALRSEHRDRVESQISHSIDTVRMLHGLRV